jgi:uncharacterized phage protein (TIGR01671 family)
MNRPLKFRVWNKKSNEWCGTIGLNKTISHNELEYDTDDLVFVQYTGLKDSKGKEIYEGDILLEYIANETQTKLGICKEILGGWKIFAYPDSSICWHGWKQEVIGNIFENPELLK